MTCIIGIEDDKAAYLITDSCVTDGWSVSNQLAYSKIATVGDLLIGITGDTRMADVVAWHFEPRIQDAHEVDAHYVSVGVADAIRQLLKNVGYSEINNNKETTYGTMLIAYHGILYHVSSEYGIMRTQDRLYAIGSGYLVALGAMKALQPYLAIPERLQRASEVVSSTISSVSAAFLAYKQEKT